MGAHFRCCRRMFVCIYIFFDNNDGKHNRTKLSTNIQKFIYNDNNKQNNGNSIEINENVDCYE